jgi:hypothetical protein
MLALHALIIVSYSFTLKLATKCSDYLGNLKVLQG